MGGVLSSASQLWSKTQANTNQSLLDSQYRRKKRLHCNFNDGGVDPYLSEFAMPGTLESLLDLATCVGMLETPTGSMANIDQMLTKATGILCPSLYIHKLWGLSVHRI